MTTGASPISAEVMDFLRICFGATVIEGYGMTETACTICMTAPGDTSSGHVGGPLACCEVKLADIVEMGYTTADRPHPRGEVRSRRVSFVAKAWEHMWRYCVYERVWCTHFIVCDLVVHKRAPSYLGSWMA